MKPRVCVTVLISSLAIVIAGDASCEERTLTPVEIVRELGDAQARIAHGDETVHAAQRAMIADIGRKLVEVSPAAWKEPRNVRAAVAYVLGGGDPRVLTVITQSGEAPKEELALVGGGLAYSEGRTAEARELLSGIDARSLGPTVAGHLALVQSDLTDPSDPAKAMAHLDDARLLAPGVLVEEAALRRQIALAADIRDVPKFITLSSLYLRRFATSVYAGSFRRQFAVGVAQQSSKDGTNVLAGLRRELEALEREHRKDLYLSVARESAARGSVITARYAAQEAAAISDDGSLASERAKIYEGAALIVSSEFETGLSALQAANRTKLPQEDLQLLDTALNVANQIRPASSESWKRYSPSLGGSETEPDKPSRVVQLARSQIARLDKILGEKTE